MTPDCELLRRYAEQGDEAAFAEVVGRHVDLVYSAALRLVGGDAHLAQDVAQGVFTALARRAARLARHASIVGWLYTTTRYTAGNLRRSRHRRRVREQEAYAMNQPTPSSEINWDALQPVLDEAVCALATADREAVLLRFFQNKSHREVGDALGLGEEAARKRVDRALEKLRAHFARRGMAVSAGVLAAEIGANSVQAAPVGMAASLTGTSLAGAGAAAESIFLRIFLMSTKTKLLAASVIVLLFALFGGGVWWFTRPTIGTPQKTVAVQSPAKTIAPTIATPVAQVEAPKLPSAPPKSVDAVPAPADPQADLKTAIPDIARLAEAGDSAAIDEIYYPPGSVDPKIIQRTRSQQQKAAKVAAQSPRLQQQLQQIDDAAARSWQALEAQTPTFNAAGNEATYMYSLSELTSGQTGARPKTFIKINGKWYIKPPDVKGTIIFDTQGDSPPN